MRLRKNIQFFLISLNKFFWFNRWGRSRYRFFIKSFVRIAKNNFPEIKYIFLRNSLASESWQPWESDIDITLLIDNGLSGKTELDFLQRFWRKVFSFPLIYLIFRHIDIFKINEFQLVRERQSLAYYYQSLLLIYNRSGENLKPKSTRERTSNLSFQFRDWLSLHQYLREGRLSQFYLRKYIRVFRKLYLSRQKDNLSSDQLKAVLEKPGKETSEESVAVFLARALKASLEIFAFLWEKERKPAEEYTYAEEINSATDFVLGKEAVKCQEVKRYCEKLIEDVGEKQDSLVSALLQAEPFSLENYRLWLVLNKQPAEEFLTKLIKIVTSRENKKMQSLNLSLFLVNEDIFKGAISQDQYCFFDYFNFKKAVVVWGNDLRKELFPFAHKELTEVLKDKLLVYLASIRDAFRKDKPDKLEGFCFSRILSIYLFFKEGIILTNPRAIFERTIKVVGEEKERALLKKAQENLPVSSAELFIFCREKIKECFFWSQGGARLP